MQIVVNTRLLLKNRLEGIGWFSYQTLKRITTNNPEVHFVFLFDRPYDESFVFSDNITPLTVSPQARHPFLYYLWMQYSVKQLVTRLEPDLFVSPDGMLSLGARYRQLPVIHDINFLHHPGDLKWLTSKYYNHFFPRFAREATRIATVSEYSRQDIASNYGVPPENIDVVYNGVNPFFSPVDEATRHTTRQRVTGGPEYFVYVGSLHPRKNISTLVKAFAAFKSESGSDIKLVLAGPDFWGMGDIRRTVEATQLRDEVVFTGRLSNDDLALVVGSAKALTFIPYYEGFGIPVIEAMAAGVPVITSKVTSLPEVAGSAALLVNPMDVTEVKNAMLQLHNDAALRSNLIEKGFVRQQRFSWDFSAELFWKSMQRAMDAAPR